VIMTPQRILQANAVSTAGCAVAMLAMRGVLPSWFGLGTPALLDALAIVFLAYAGALVVVAARRPVARRALIAFAVADAAWVVVSAVVLLAFWSELASIARLAIVAVALVVDVFAALQFRAAGGWSRRVPEAA
jgi:hypothetical protein